MGKLVCPTEKRRWQHTAWQAGKQDAHRLPGLGTSQGHPRAGNCSFAWLEFPLPFEMRCLGPGCFPDWKPGTLLGVPSGRRSPLGPQQDQLALLFLWDTASSPPLPTPSFPPAWGCVAFCWSVPAEEVQDPPSHPTTMGHVPCQLQHRGGGGFRLGAPQGRVPEGSAPSSSVGRPSPPQQQVMSLTRVSVHPYRMWTTSITARTAGSSTCWTSATWRAGGSPGRAACRAVLPCRELVPVLPFRGAGVAQRPPLLALEAFIALHAPRPPRLPADAPPHQTRRALSHGTTAPEAGQPHPTSPPRPFITLK